MPEQCCPSAAECASRHLTTPNPPPSAGVIPALTPHPVFPVLCCLALFIHRTDHVPVNIRSRLITVFTHYSLFTSDHLLRSSRVLEQGMSVQGERWSSGASECLSIGIPEQLINGGPQQWSAYAVAHRSSGVLQPYRGIATSFNCLTQ